MKTTQATLLWVLFGLILTIPMGLTISFPEYSKFIGVATFSSLLTLIAGLIIALKKSNN